MDSVVGALNAVGVTIGNLTGVGSKSSASALTLVWTFQLNVPLTKAKDTSVSLMALEKTIAGGNGQLSLSFDWYAQASGPTSQTCDVAGLIADARAQAQKLAGAAGSAAGTITGITTTVAQPFSDCSLTATFGLGYSGNPGPRLITITASHTASPP